MQLTFYLNLKRNTVKNRRTIKAKNANPSHPIEVITGIGGVGKTQLAVEYVYLYRKEYAVIWWMRAEGPVTLASDYTGLADMIGAEAIDSPESQVANQDAKVQAIRRWLDNESDWLLVFDNAQKPEDIVEYLPHQGNGHVLITSRTQKWGGTADGDSELGVFKAVEAVDFIAKRTGQFDKGASDALARELGCLPLALEQAGSYIKTRHQSINEYRVLFRAHHEALLKRERPLNYPDTVATTWEISFQQAERETKSAADLLAICAYMAPDNIPRRLFSDVHSSLAEGRPLLADDVEFGDAVAALQNYSLIAATEDVISIHRLVQMIVRDRLSKDDERKWAEVALQLLNDAFSFDEKDRATWPSCAAFMPHILETKEHTEKLGIASEIVAALLTKAASCLLVHADYNTARLFYERSLTIRKDIHGDKHPDVATSLDNLGHVYDSLGEYRQAKHWYEQALTIRKDIHGDKHPDVATSLNGLGLTLWHLGQYPEAQEHLEKALATYEAVYGPYVATALNNLGLVFDSLKELEKARACHEQALALRRRIFGNKHQAVGMSLNNLGAVLIKLGDLKQAKEKLEEALTIYETAYGDKHPNVAIILNQLGGVFMRLHDYPQAKEKLEESVRISRIVFGDKHSQVAIAISNLGVTLSYLGETDQAKKSSKSRSGLAKLR